jgi:hypothetical protein
VAPDRDVCGTAQQERCQHAGTVSRRVATPSRPNRISGMARLTRSVLHERRRTSWPGTSQENRHERTPQAHRHPACRPLPCFAQAELPAATDA